MTQNMGNQRIRCWIRLPGMLCTGEIFTALDPYLDLGGQVIDAQLPCESLEDAANSLLALARTQDGPVGIIGLSLGAIVAMAAMVKEPDAFTAAVLISTTPRSPRAEQFGAWQEMARRTTDGAFLAVADQLTPGLYAPSRSTPTLLGSARSMAEDTGPQAFIDQLKIQLSRRDLRPELHRIRARSLVLSGAHDQLCNLDVHQDIVDAIPTAELHVFSDLGHLMTLEDPASVANIINLWNLRNTH